MTQATAETSASSAWSGPDDGLAHLLDGFGLERAR
jgi:hypothetical protein